MSLDVYLSCRCCGQQVGDHNVTHNLTKMASEAGIYQHLWHPEEVAISLAGHLVVPLDDAIDDLRSRPEHYRQFNPANGWGSYDGFVDFLVQLRSDCLQVPYAEVTVSR
jgi:hypothetical protein